MTTARALATATLLVHPDPSAPLSLSTDASDSHMGAALQQFHHGIWQPLSFFSAKFNPTQQRYSTFNRELQALYTSLLHF